MTFSLFLRVMVYAIFLRYHYNALRDAKTRYHTITTVSDDRRLAAFRTTWDEADAIMERNQ